MKFFKFVIIFIACLVSSKQLHGAMGSNTISLWKNRVGPNVSVSVPPLHLAVSYGDINSFIYFIERFPESIFEKDQYGMIPYDIALFLYKSPLAFQNPWYRAQIQEFLLLLSLRMKLAQRLPILFKRDDLPETSDYDSEIETVGSLDLDHDEQEIEDLLWEATTAYQRAIYID